MWDEVREKAGRPPSRVNRHPKELKLPLVIEATVRVLGERVRHEAAPAKVGCPKVTRPWRSQGLVDAKVEGKACRLREGNG